MDALTAGERVRVTLPDGTTAEGEWRDRYVNDHEAKLGQLCFDDHGLAWLPVLRGMDVERVPMVTVPTRPGRYVVETADGLGVWIWALDGGRWWFQSGAEVSKGGLRRATAFYPVSPHAEGTPVPDRIGVIVMDTDGVAWARGRDQWAALDRLWMSYGDLVRSHGPLRVLYVPEETSSAEVGR